MQALNLLPLDRSSTWPYFPKNFARIHSLPIPRTAHSLPYFSHIEPVSHSLIAAITSSLFIKTSDMKSFSQSKAPSFVFKDSFGVNPVEDE